ncbi:MAG TPA: hypothetical protein VMF09_07455 [Solirubrobacteraceae bacterium]|nr:hypothetical protein [Solirubrobacteraceae bacterium]
MRKIAAGQLGEQLGAILARIEAMTDDLAALDRGEDERALSPEGRHIFERSGADGIRNRVKALEAERAEVAQHADRLRGKQRGRADDLG